MDIGSAFTFMFDDRRWIDKLAVGGGLALAAFALSPILVGLLLLLPVAGYLLETLENVRDRRPAPLPGWRGRAGRLYSRGLAVFVIWLAYNMPALLIFCVSMGVDIVALGVEPDTAAALGLASIVLGYVQFAFSLLGNALFPAALIRYAGYGTLRSAFHLDQILDLITANPADYVNAVLAGWVAQIMAVWGIVLCGVGLFFTLFWSILVTAHLCGQLARKMAAPAWLVVEPRAWPELPAPPRQILALPPPRSPLPPGPPEPFPPRAWRIAD